MNDNVDQLVRASVRALEPYKAVEPPEELARREGIPASMVIKMDANENPYGPSPRVAEALGQFEGFNIYPDPFQREVRAALSAYTNVPMECIVAGAGADELIDIVVRLTMDPGDKALDLVPTFGMYSVTMKLAGVEVVPVPRNESFGVDVEAVRAAKDDRTKLVFLCNPNNPTGTLSPEVDVRSLLDMGLIVVVDETYHEFSGFTVAHLVEEYPKPRHTAQPEQMGPGWLVCGWATASCTPGWWRTSWASSSHTTSAWWRRPRSTRRCRTRTRCCRKCAPWWRSGSGCAACWKTAWACTATRPRATSSCAISRRAARRSCRRNWQSEASLCGGSTRAGCTIAFAFRRASRRIRTR